MTSTVLHLFARRLVVTGEIALRQMSVRVHQNGLVQTVGLQYARRDVTQVSVLLQILVCARRNGVVLIAPDQSVRKANSFRSSQATQLMQRSPSLQLSPLMMGPAAQCPLRYTMSTCRVGMPAGAMQQMDSRAGSQGGFPR